MANFLLVHGEWHDARMWDGVVRHLESAKNSLDIGEIIAMDLPGHGLRQSFDIRRITTDYYIEAAVTPVQVKRLSHITLVAHSFAATFAPQVASRLGDALERIIFIGGMIPSEGVAPLDTLPFLTRKMASIFGPQEKGIRLPSIVLKRALYNDVGGVEATKRVGRLVPDPYLPWVTPMPALKFPDGVPLTYVALSEDKFLTLEMQRAYAASLPSAEVIEIKAGHEAPLVRSEMIAEILLRGVGVRQEEKTDEEEGQAAEQEEVAKVEDE